MNSPTSIRRRSLPTIVLLAAGLPAVIPAAPARAESSSMLMVRSPQAELHYRLSGASPAAEVRLWYTRDRGATWERGAIHRDHTQPILFDAPAEGLYGFILIVDDNGHVSRQPPVENDTPQRWVFVDYTPPLVQWDSVEPAEGFTERRMLHLRWTAHDSNFSTRPVTLSYQSSVDQVWHVAEQALPNTGRLDWTMPEDLGGQITLKLTLRDLGGHVVERCFGPVPVERWQATGGQLEAPATQPASLAATRPADSPISNVSKADRDKARKTYREASVHMLRHEYALAAQRLREALELDPNLLEALNDLACIHHLQKDYPKAIELFNEVLARDANYVSALRGAHGSYIAQRQYNKSREMLNRLLKLNSADAQASLDLGDVLFMMGDVDGAREYWGRARTVDPSAADIIKLADTRLKAFGPPEALTDAGKD